MASGSERKPSNHICVGLLAHVDAGKTTLAEQLLYRTGSIRRLGRVDHQDAFLDTEAVEKARGITVFSKQACLSLGEWEVTLLDTPGHVDFSAEMERTLQVLDCAVLLISGADGVQGHVETLWRLLARYEIPTFLFINKMDQPGTDPAKLMGELQARLDGRCTAFSVVTKEGAAGPADRTGFVPVPYPEDFWENAAVCDDALLERYLDGGRIGEEEIRKLIGERKIFPCFFGSALKGFGVEELLSGLHRFLRPPLYPQAFGARVFKITRDAQGNRLTHLKVTGGSLRVKMPLTNRRDGMEEADVWEEKADQLRLYSGAGYKTVQEALPGTVCAVTGLSHTFAGQGLGHETASVLPLLEPVLTYRVVPTEDDVKCDPHALFLKLKELEEEEPELSILWQEETGEIHAQVMGEVQTEVLTGQIRERFGIRAAFADGSIVYKETVAAPVEGVGHFEPLRHYAEVHLLLEPGEPGSGLQFAAACSEDVLDRNWQRLVLTHLEEKKHKGVLVGGEITDMRISLVAGRAHIKHTEGGDFRQATYRALRQGLRKAHCVLLEPVYAFRLEVPAENLGRAMNDIQLRQGKFSVPEQEGEFAVLTGSAPVSEMTGYQREVTAYTKGRGRLSCTLKGYEPCHNAQEVIDRFAYDPEADLENPTGSVFCAHGAGFVVPWDQVERYMHLESCLQAEGAADTAQADEGTDFAGSGPAGAGSGGPRTSLPAGVTDEELEAIFTRTYGTAGQERAGYKKKRLMEPTAGRRGKGAGASYSDGAGKGAGGAAQPDGAGNAAGPSQSGGAGNAAGASRSGNAGTAADAQRSLSGSQPFFSKKGAAGQDEFLLVDGYNIIFAWEKLRELSRANIESARHQLMDILSDYQGFMGCTVILVFDAYRVEGGQGSVSKYHNIYVVFTKEAETEDQYIEKTVHRIGRKYQVTVATSDALEQVIIYGQGARRMSAAELLAEIQSAREQMREVWEKKRSREKNYLFDHLSAELAEWMEEVRLGRRSVDG